MATPPIIAVVLTAIATVGAFNIYRQPQQPSVYMSRAAHLSGTLRSRPMMSTPTASSRCKTMPAHGLIWTISVTTIANVSGVELDMSQNWLG